MDSINDMAEVKAINVLGWLGTALALQLNLANVNNLLTVIISLLSIVFIAAKIYFLFKRKGK